MTVTPVFIMGVPWEAQRADNAADLAKQTDGEIVWDQTRNSFDTWRLTLKAVGADAAIIIEDDVALTSNWRVKVEAVISAHPRVVIQFFSLRKDDLSLGSRREPGETFRMNQCYYLPPGAAAGLLEYSTVPRAVEYDKTMAMWMQENKMPYWLSVPSLAQHLPWLSVITSRTRGAQSVSFQP